MSAKITRCCTGSPLQAVKNIANRLALGARPTASLRLASVKPDTFDVPVPEI